MDPVPADGTAGALPGSEPSARPPVDGSEDLGRRNDLLGHHNQVILVIMSAASISELKANLSRYLREVRRGGEVQVLERGVPIARLVPPADKGEDGVRERLVGAGLLRPGEGRAEAVLDAAPLELPASISGALAEDRQERL